MVVVGKGAGAVKCKDEGATSGMINRAVRSGPGKGMQGVRLGKRGLKV